MKLLIILLFFVATVGAMAQNKMAPLPSLIIIYSTNQSALVSIIQPSSLSWHEDYANQKSVISNLELTCMSVKSVTTKQEGDCVLVVLHDAMVYCPTVIAGKYGSNQKLQTMTVGKFPLRLYKSQLVQVNGEILRAESLLRRYETIP